MLQKLSIFILVKVKLKNIFRNGLAIFHKTEYLKLQEYFIKEFS